MSPLISPNFLSFGSSPAYLRLAELLLLLTFMVTPLYASDQTDDLCTAGGYYSGAEERFLSGLAMYIRIKKGILNDAKCSALWSYAYDVGAYFSRNGKFKRPEDAQIGKKASEFSTRAYESILKNMELR